MGTVKKNFIAGDKLTAQELNDNFEELQPVTAYSANSAGNLACGASGTLAALKLIDDGAFDIDIDGIARILTGLDFSVSNMVLFDSGGATNSRTTLSTTRWFAITFTTGASDTNVGSVKLDFFDAGKTYTVEIREWAGNQPTGSAIDGEIKQVTTVATNVTEFVFDNPVTVSPSTTYAIIVKGFVNDFGNIGISNTSSSYHTDNSGSSWVSGTGICWHQVYTAEAEVEDFDDAATIIQTAIRALTSSTEVVAYDTDHFVITSATTGLSSIIDYMTAPASGTDLTTSTYLNGLTGVATKTVGTSNEGKIFQLNENGRIPQDMIEP